MKYRSVESSYSFDVNKQVLIVYVAYEHPDTGSRHLSWSYFVLHIGSYNIYEV